MTFVVSTSQVYLCRIPGRNEGFRFRVAAISPDGDVLMSRVDPGPWGYYSGSIAVRDTDLVDESLWKPVTETDDEP